MKYVFKHVDNLQFAQKKKNMIYYRLCLVLKNFPTILVISNLRTHMYGALNAKNFLQYSSYRIFEHMYVALNVVEKIINYVVQL